MKNGIPETLEEALKLIEKQNQDLLLKNQTIENQQIEIAEKTKRNSRSTC